MGFDLAIPVFRGSCLTNYATTHDTDEKFSFKCTVMEIEKRLLINDRLRFQRYLENFASQLIVILQ